MYELYAQQSPTFRTMPMGFSWNPLQTPQTQQMSPASEYMPQTTPVSSSMESRGVGGSSEYDTSGLFQQLLGSLVENSPAQPAPQLLSKAMFAPAEIPQPVQRRSAANMLANPYF